MRRVASVTRRRGARTQRAIRLTDKEEVAMTGWRKWMAGVAVPAEPAGEDSYVINKTREEKPFQTQKTPGFPEKREGGLGIQNRSSSQGANRPQSPKHEGESHNPPSQ
jgi:hypothetical protein